MANFYPYNYKGYPEGFNEPWACPMPTEAERDRRWGAIRRSMERHNIDCLIIGGPMGYMSSVHHLCYVSNYIPFVNHGTFAVFPLSGEPQSV